MNMLINSLLRWLLLFIDFLLILILSVIFDTQCDVIGINVNVYMIILIFIALRIIPEFKLITLQGFNTLDEKPKPNKLIPLYLFSRILFITKLGFLLLLFNLLLYILGFIY